MVFVREDVNETPAWKRQLDLGERPTFDGAQERQHDAELFAQVCLEALAAELLVDLLGPGGNEFVLHDLRHGLRSRVVERSACGESRTDFL